MMRALRFLRGILSLLTFTCAIVALVGLGNPEGARTAAIALPPGWTRVEIQGTISAVTPRTGTLLLSVPQREKRTVKVVSGSVVQMKTSFVEDITELRVGDDVKVWGYAQPDGILLAAHVLVVNRRGASALTVSAAPPSPRLGLSGVVLAATEDALTVLTETGQLKEVLRTAIARVEGGAGPAELREFDIVRIEGEMLSDGNVSATRIVVEFAGATARRLSGRITMVVPEASLFVLDDTIFVNVVPDTFIIQGTALRTVRDLGVGRSVRLVGASWATLFIVKPRIVALSL